MYIIGRHIKTIFYNEQNGFMVGLIKVIESDDEVTTDEIVWVGHSLVVKEGDEYKFWGEIKHHVKYGAQLAVTKIDKIFPKQSNQVVLYLSSDLFPQIGAKTAQTIVDYLGNDAIEKILTQKEALAEVPIAPQKKTIIYQNLLANEEMNQVMTQLIELGFSMAEAVKIYQQFRGNTRHIMENDLYELYFSLPELGFIKIDNIAQRSNISMAQRMKAFLLYRLKTVLFAQGHCYIQQDEFINLLAEERHNISLEQIQTGLEQLAEQNHLMIDDNKLYLTDYYHAEVYIASYLKQTNKTSKINNFADKIQQIMERQQITYDEKQQQAIKTSLEAQFSLISGGPGTGKSTIIKGILDMYGEQHGLSQKEVAKKVAVLAPTGRASKRLRDITNMPAKTIHRFLRWQKEKDEFLINENNKTDKQVIIVDEASMIDLLLFVNLLKALPAQTKLILIGDADQLPPVSPGQIFKDLIASAVFATVFLTKNYRQTTNNFLPRLAELVREGKLSEAMEEEFADYTFLACTPNEIMPKLRELQHSLPTTNMFDVQIIAPVYKGVNGIDQINHQMQAVLNDNGGAELKYQNTIFREHDKVIQLNNLPENDVFNGDMGMIETINKASETASGKVEVMVNFYGRKIKYLASDLYHLKHAYAISVHKSQGSEFNYVIVPLCRGYYWMLYRLLFYTAITRSKHKLILVGEKAMLERAVLNEAEIKRNSYLIERILA